MQRKWDRMPGLLFAITILFWCAQYSYTQFVNPELTRMDASASFMGLAAGVYGLSQTLLRIPLGFLADRIGKQKPFIMLGSALPVLAAGLLLLWYTPNGFLTMRLLSGMAAASWVSFTVLYGSYFPPEEGPSRISFLNLANIAGKLLGFAGALVLVPLLGIRSSFAISMAAAGAAFLLSTMLREAPRERMGMTLKDLRMVSRDKYLLACSAVGAMIQAASFATYFGFTVNAAVAIGASSAEITWMNIALMVPSIFANFYIPRIIRRAGAARLVTLGCVLAAIYAFLVPYATNMTQLYLLQIVAGVSTSLTFAVLLGQPIRDIPQRCRGAAMGLYQAAYGIGMTAGPALMGVLIDLSDLKTAFIAVAAFSFVTAFVAGYLLSGVSRLRINRQ